MSGQLDRLLDQGPARFRFAARARLACWLFALAIAPVIVRGQEKQDRAVPPSSGAALYNGIVRPSPWPPRTDSYPHEPVEPPYLVSPPEVIDIDVGRQLFVDDFLTDQTTLHRTYHQATYYEENPVLKPDRPWETETEPNPTAMVFSDGVWYDAQDRLFKMWYMAGYVAGTAYATSHDGIHWDKPALDVTAGTNLVQHGRRDSGTVWLDLGAADPGERYKMTLWQSGALSLSVSPDGIHWSEPVQSGPVGDRTTFFYNPFLGRWVFSLRYGESPFGRVRRYWEAEDFLAGAGWKPDEPVRWVAADNADPKRDDLKVQPQLYNLDCVAYESLLVGLFSIWRGQPGERAKPNEVCLGFSRDGFHWHRPDRRAFIPVSEHYGDWNWGNVQSAGGGCLVVGDRLYFYVSGRAGIPGKRDSGVCSTGLAFLRRDGFASMDAEDDPGTLTTRPLRFHGKHLFVNADVDGGELRVEVLDADGKVAPPFSRESCTPIRADDTLQAVEWKGTGDLAAVAGKPVRFRFTLRNGRLYSFWVSPERSGASHGYVAAGGPGLAGPTDTAGGAVSSFRSAPRKDD
jgi:hypothetical protein